MPVNWTDVGITIAAVLVGVVTGVSNQILKSIKMRWNEKHKANYINRFHAVAALDLNIHALLTACRISQKATRVALLRYHNGEYFIDGSPIQKITCTNESVAVGISYLLAESLSVSSLAVGLDTLIQAPTKFFEISHLTDDRFRRLMESLGGKYISGIPIMVGKHQMSGVIIVAWNHSFQPVPEFLTDTLEQTAREVGNEIVRMQVQGG